MILSFFEFKWHIFLVKKNAQKLIWHAILIKVLMFMLQKTTANNIYIILIYAKTTEVESKPSPNVLCFSNNFPHHKRPKKKKLWAAERFEKNWKIIQYGIKIRNIQKGIISISKNSIKIYDKNNFLVILHQLYLC